MPELVDHAIFPQADGWSELSERVSDGPDHRSVGRDDGSRPGRGPDGVVTGIESVRAMQWVVAEPATEARIVVRRTGIESACGSATTPKDMSGSTPDIRSLKSDRDQP